MFKWINMMMARTNTSIVKTLIFLCFIFAFRWSECADYTCTERCINCNIENCTRCKPEYNLMNGKCLQCPNCVNCSSNESCITCKTGFYNENGNCKSCNQLCERCLSKDTCAECIGSYFVNSQQKCEACATGCRKCNAVQFCSDCLPRHHLINGECKTCGTNCLNCSTSNNCNKCDDGFQVGTGKCEHCVAGKYLRVKFDIKKNTQKNVCSNCLETCTECESISNCLLCKSGFYGTECQHECALCKSDNCSKTNCIHGCKDGYFVDSNGGCSRCIGCIDDLCMDTTGKCMHRCKDGYYLENDQCYVCQNKYCTTCSSLGKCYSCQKGKWDIDCNLDCSTQCINSVCDISTAACEKCDLGFYLSSNNTCLHCPDYCTTCDSNFSCKSCVDGHFGKTCDDFCSTNCKTCSINNMISCSTCFQGNYIDSNNFECNSCVEGCLSCLSKTNCTSCVFGYFLSNDTCHKCHEHCLSCSSNKTCSKCDDGYFGATCSESCLEQCQTCNSNVSCATCEEGLFSNDDVVTEKLCKCSIHECSRRGNKCLACHKSNWFPLQSGCCPCKLSNASGGELSLVNCLKGATETGDDENEDVPWLLIGGIGVAIVFFLFFVTRSILYVRKIKSKNATSNQSSRERIYENVNLNARNSIATPDSEQKESNIIDIHLPEDSAAVDRKERDIPSIAVVDIENHYYNMCTIQEKRTVRLEQLQEYVTNMSKDQYKKDFLELPQGLVLPYVYALQNRSKCRYDKIFPYDETRVVLRDGECDFINANYINGYNKAKAYIASSGPTKKTMADFVDFWRMIWQENVEKIVMLTHLVEKKVMKCEQYWPKPGCSTMYGDITVLCHSQDAYADYTIRVFYIAKGTDTRSIHHLHYTSWPDKRVPDDVTSLVEFRHKVQNITCNTDGPIVVHCSAGIGRTGTYIAMDILIHQAISDGYLNIYGCVEWLRRQRVRLVQTEEQYIYLHYVLVHALIIEAPTIRAEDFHVVMENVDDIYTEFMKLSETAKLLRFKETTTPDTIPVDEIELLSDIGNRSISFKHRPSQIMKREQETSDENVMYIDSFKSKRRYLLSSTPIADSIDTFLHLVIGTDSTSVVSMGDSNGHENKMFGKFLPTLHECYTYGALHITCTQEIEKTSFSARTIKIQTSKFQEERSVTFYQFKHCNENLTVPTDAIEFVEFIQEVEGNVTANTSQHLIILHCNSNGEMCGLFCTVSILIQKLEIEHEVSVNNLVTQLKAKREELIPNKEQYLFCYKCIDAYIESFSMYSNFT